MLSQNGNYFVFLCVFVIKIGHVYPVGESAVVKNGAARAVRSGVAVTDNANDVFEFCNTSHLNKLERMGAGTVCRNFSSCQALTFQESQTTLLKLSRTHGASTQ